MSATFPAIDAPAPTPGAAGLNAKPLWIAIAALSVAVIGLGGVLVNDRLSRASEGSAAVAKALPAITPPVTGPVVVAATAPPDIKTDTQADSPAAIAAQAASPKPEVTVAPSSEPHKKPVHARSTMAKPVSSLQPVPEPVPLVTPTAEVPPVEQLPVVVKSVVKPLCINCGSVESVTPVDRMGTPSGVGAVAGGVLGGVIGNQVARGNGRTGAAILGAIGGSIAGHALEKGMSKSTHYEIRVRMDDGSLRTLEQVNPVSAGDKVVIDNGVLRPAPATTNPAGIAPTPHAAKVYGTQ